MHLPIKRDKLVQVWRGAGEESGKRVEYRRWRGRGEGDVHGLVPSTPSIDRQTELPRQWGVRNVRPRSIHQRRHEQSQVNYVDLWRPSRRGSVRDFVGVLGCSSVVRGQARAGAFSRSVWIRFDWGFVGGGGGRGTRWTANFAFFVV